MLEEASLFLLEVFTRTEDFASLLPPVVQSCSQLTTCSVSSLAL